ncbi:MAG TPA: helix-turn-helix domain-containing protein [Blastocatellia bacterium]|nr:helix-turn-helix domain-containing protein [Blastocatellia bacterium]
MAEYTINELVNLSGVNRRNIYFYVQQGILPPPEGAGLGARYSDEHLTRLRVIPVLRSRGLRLDEIRERLESADAGAIEAMLAEQEPAPARALRSEPAERPAPQSLLRYRLDEGVELLVEASAVARSRSRVTELIEEARRIFNRRTNPRQNGGK